MKNIALSLLLFVSAAFSYAQTFNANQQYEKLSRGVVAVKTDNGVFISWRVLGTDSKDCAFNVYRDGILLNSKPLHVSNYTDIDGTAESSYVVKTVVDGNIIDAETVTPWKDAYLTLNICPPVKDNSIEREEQPRAERPNFQPQTDHPRGGMQNGNRPRGEGQRGNRSRGEGQRGNRPRGGGRGWPQPTHKYSPNDCSVADVDGDGNYELILKWEPYNAHDNSHVGYTEPVYIDCYKLNLQQPQSSPSSTAPVSEASASECSSSCNNLLWRICLGKNIRAGAHYTQFLAYDFDGDGKAELACKTAPGTIDGKGKAVLLPGDDKDADYIGKEGRLLGRVIGGPEYLTVFSGSTGEELATVPYKPALKDIDYWGDDNFNRSERYLACVAYLDGKKPSMVFCRGYYTQSNLAAYSFDGKNITLKWLHQSLERGNNSAFGQGAHSVAVGDVDNDGCDEIIYGSATIDNDGKLLSSTNLGHGDALHLGDLLPDRPGLEVFMVHEGKQANYCAEIHDPVTGKILWREDSQTGEDNGRGVAMNCFPDAKGYQWWSLASRNIFTAEGNSGKKLAELADGSRRPTNFRIYWDGDLLDEPFDGNTVYKPTLKDGKVDFQQFVKLKGSACNSSKNTPNILADIFGDWREEVILYDRESCDKLYIHTTTIPSEHRVPTLMHDHIYRMSVAWQNVCYNQPPHLGYLLAK